MNKVLEQRLSDSDNCLYPGCQKPLGREGGIVMAGSRYCDEYCFESMRCWINTQMMLCHWLVDWAEAIRRTHGSPSQDQAAD